MAGYPRQQPAPYPVQQSGPVYAKPGEINNGYVKPVCDISGGPIYHPIKNRPSRLDSKYDGPVPVTNIS